MSLARCATCTGMVVPPETVCFICRRNQHSRKNYQKRKQSGKCVRCNNQPRPGLSLCLACERKKAASMRQVHGYAPRNCSSCGEPGHLAKTCEKKEGVG